VAPYAKYRSILLAFFFFFFGYSDNYDDDFSEAHLRRTN
jgi:hypothetical protein